MISELNWFLTDFRGWVLNFLILYSGKEKRKEWRAIPPRSKCNWSLADQNTILNYAIHGIIWNSKMYLASVLAETKRAVPHDVFVFWVFFYWRFSWFHITLALRRRTLLRLRLRAIWIKIRRTVKKISSMHWH